MKTKRVILIALLCATAFLTGCMWMRLLALKDQLSQFDRYVKVDDRDGLAFEFAKPVLYSKDILTLLELDPTTRTTNGDQQTWSWTFEKVPAAPHEPKDYDLTFTTRFDRDKLSRLEVPARFLGFVPKASIVAIARAFGHARVDRKNRSAAAQWRGNEPHADTNRFTRTELTQMLGAPLRQEESKEHYGHFYEYRLKSPSLPKGKPMIARARCLFNRDTQKLTRVEVRYSNLRMDLSFDAK